MNLIPGFIGVDSPVSVPNTECVECGGPIQEGTRNVLCPSGGVGCMVAHYETQRWCVDCGGMVYQRLETA